MKIEKEEMLFMKKSVKTTLFGSAAVLMSVSLAACGNLSASKSPKKTTAPKTEKVQPKKSSASSATSAAESSAVSSSVSSKASSMSNASSSSTVSAKNITPQQMGIILAMDQEPDVISNYLGNSLWYGVANSNNGGTDETNGYNYISTHGDGTADIYWQVNGDMVTFKRLDPNSGDCVADEKMMTKTVPVAQLVQKYYSTPQQQSQVNNDANQLKQGNN